ncbi:hypothetical protein [Kutzneria albida]|uniref:Uncharacterized protein n=1 Tax=Kutzneria albida DSM 43870 TaxID=1449976 RepID=W5WCK2_9PSEU|nr:hypothetical protein [Kutzneria albida]AHH98266.1 hypothetical protein KALB_4904 [Kutzneria albida DSM 43870]
MSVLHRSNDDEPDRDGYVYGALGIGVPKSCVQAVLNRWAAISPNGSAAQTLECVDSSFIHEVNNLARLAVEAALLELERQP